MAANFNEEGLKKIREYIHNNWKYIAIRDDAGIEFLNIDTSDARVSYVEDFNTNPMILQLVFKGTDLDIGLGRKIGGVVLYDVDVNGEPLLEVTYSTSFEFQSVDDQVTLRLAIKVPGL